MRALVLAVLVTAGLAVTACDGQPTGDTEVTIRLTGPGSYFFPITIISGNQPAQQSKVELPWTSPAVRTTKGTYVSVTVGTTNDPTPVTCQLLSNGRLVQASSGGEGHPVTCAGKV